MLLLNYYFKSCKHKVNYYKCVQRAHCSLKARIYLFKFTKCIKNSIGP